jgi:Na+-translocating ferredoxin:NAD+ oxidoreductase RnfA subunit
MTQKLTLVNTLTYLVIFFGTSSIGYWLVMLIMAWMRARAGGADIDAIAATTSLALKGLTAGAVIAIGGVVARLILKPGRQRPQ